MFYKIIYQKIIIDVIKNPTYLKYVKSSNRFRETDETSANAVFSSDCSSKYHISGTAKINDGNYYKDVTLVEISKDEYNEILSGLSENNSNKNYGLDIESLQSAKISEMKAACNTAIISGFDIFLSDGISYHFSLEITDQLNISKLANKALRGAEFLAWHSDGSLCRFYSAKDILSINNKMENYIEYHTTYFNSLKNYIKNIYNENVLVDINYGIEIPVAYQSEVLKNIYEGN